MLRVIGKFQYYRLVVFRSISKPRSSAVGIIAADRAIELSSIRLIIPLT